jgi:hypothetical protein
MLRLAALYSRSRFVPAAVGMTVAGGLGLWALDTSHPRLVLLPIGLGVAVAAVGLGGADVQLDRTGAIPWPAWRLAHLVGIVVIVTGLVLVAGTDMFALIVRDTGGLTGLAALGATVLGSQLAWVPPVTWTVIAVVFPTDDEVLMWMVQAADSQTAGVVAGILGLAGAAAYMARGPRG